MPFPKHLLSLFPILLFFISCANDDSEPNAVMEIPFESAFELKETMLLPEVIFGTISYLERASNGDLLIADQSSNRTWLYLNESESWKELVLEDCHPGIETLIIGAAFSDDHIFLINSPSLSGHSFMRDGSCGTRLAESFTVPDYITGLNDGFLGYVTRPGEDIPLIVRFDSNGNALWETSFDEHPNPVYSNRVMGGGMAVGEDGRAFITSSSAPELHVLDTESGAFIQHISPLFDDVFDGINPGFDERAFPESWHMWLSRTGSHMLVAGLGLLDNDYVLFSAPTFVPQEDDEDFYLIYRLSDGAQYYVRIPEENGWTNLISGGYLHEIHFVEEQIELRIYGVNENGFPQ
ncbi:MAG: hypothetical protein LAT84_07990 [Balneolia bacterium]|nr:hypothetical protein [Balneolia bacterium]